MVRLCKASARLFAVANQRAEFAHQLAGNFLRDRDVSEWVQGVGISPSPFHYVNSTTLQALRPR